jgi:hypothetical protein
MCCGNLLIESKRVFNFLKRIFTAIPNAKNNLPHHFKKKEIILKMRRQVEHCRKTNIYCVEGN